MTSSGIANLTFPPFKTRVEMRVITIPEKMQKSLDFDGRRAPTEFASARWPGVDSQAQGMTIRLLPKTFAVARATSYGVPDADWRRPPLNPTFEGYLDRSAEAKRKGRDASRALCICRFGKDVPYERCLLLAARDELEKSTIAVTQLSRELLRQKGTKREAWRWRE